MRCSKKCARPDLPGVSSADPTRYQSMCVTTGARWSGINTTCMPFESWNMWASNSPADAHVGTPVLDAKTKRVGASRRQITWHHGPLVRGLRIIELLLQTPVTVRRAFHIMRFLRWTLGVSTSAEITSALNPIICRTALAAWVYSH